MRNLNYLLFTILFFTHSFLLYPQNSQILDLMPLEEMTKKEDHFIAKIFEISSPMQLIKDPYNGVFLNEVFLPAKIYSKNEDLLFTLARYNIKKNQVEIKINGNFRILQKNNIYGVIIDGILFVPVSSGEKEDGNIVGYYELLSRGEISLLAKYELTLYTIGSSSLHNNIGTKKEYRSSKRFYYCHKNQNPLKLKKTKKSILELFKTNHTLIKQAVDENNLGYKKEKDLITLFDLYNSQIR